MTEPISSRPPRQSGGRLLVWLPLIPPLSVLTVGALRDWRSLPGTLRAALLLFVLTQVVAAVLSPQPLVSLLLGGLRGAVICGLVAYGARAGRDLNLRPFALGVAALCVAALVTQSLLGWRTPQGTFRALEFVYANANSLSVLGVLLVWLALWDRSWGAWRWPLGTLGLAVAVLGQGRMAWLACAVGLLAAWRGRRATLTRSALLLLALGALAWAPARQALVTVLGPAISGREAVWETAARVADRWPWGGGRRIPVRRAGPGLPGRLRGPRHPDPPRPWRVPGVADGRPPAVPDRPQRRAARPGRIGPGGPAGLVDPVGHAAVGRVAVRVAPGAGGGGGHADHERVGQCHGHSVGGVRGTVLRAGRGGVRRGPARPRSAGAGAADRGGAGGC